MFIILSTLQYKKIPSLVTRNILIWPAGAGEEYTGLLKSVAHSCNPSYSGGRDQED
jgi:hypothetical protein